MFFSLTSGEYRIQGRFGESPYSMSQFIEFNEFYVNFIKSIFFTHPDKAYSQQEMQEDVPSFCKHGEMISAAINILHMRGEVIAAGKNDKNEHVYKISPEFILQDKDVKKKDALNKQIDLELKQLTKENFFLPKRLALASIIVSIGALGFTAYNVYLTKLKSKEPPPTIILTVPQQVPNSAPIEKLPGSAPIKKDTPSLKK